MVMAREEATRTAEERSTKVIRNFIFEGSYLSLLIEVSDHYCARDEKKTGAF